jgi:hypothetical protein
VINLSTKNIKITTPIINNTSSELISSDVILPNDVLSLETDTNKLKLGNGSDEYKSLPYLGRLIDSEEEDLKPYYFTQSQLDELEDPPESGLYPSLHSGRRVIVTDAPNVSIPLDTGIVKFVPTLYGTTTAGVFTYDTAANHRAVYYRIVNNIVYLTGFIGWTAIPTAPSGTLCVAMPPEIIPTRMSIPVSIVHARGFNYAGVLSLMLFIASENTNCVMYGRLNASPYTLGGLDSTLLASSGLFRFNATYSL